MSRYHNIVPGFEKMVGAGMIPGVSSINKFGYNSDIDTTTVPEDIWGPGGVYTGFPTGSPETVQVFSSDAADKGTPTAGTGARTYRIIGLESSTSTEYTYEDLTLDGTTPVVSSKTWYRINRAYVLTAGSTGSNVGTITTRHSTTTSNIFSVLPATLGQTAIACWTVPYDNIMLLDRIQVDMSRANNAAGSAQVALQTRSVGSSSWRTREFYSITNSWGVAEKYDYPIKIEGLTDIRMRAVAVGSNDTRVSAGFSGCYGHSKNITNALLARAEI